jgi:serine/threonine protein kinase
MVNQIANQDFIAYVIDLGSGIQVGNDMDTKSIIAREWSVCFASPEILNDDTPHFASDVWSLGCVLFFMVTQKAPWNSETRAKNLKKTDKYIEAKESLVFGCNDDYL